MNWLCVKPTLESVDFPIDFRDCAVRRFTELYYPEDP